MAYDRLKGIGLKVVSIEMRGTSVTIWVDNGKGCNQLNGERLTICGDAKGRHGVMTAKYAECDIKWRVPE